MRELTDDAKRYRVRLWLDDLGAIARRLSDAECALEELDAEGDSLKAVRYDMPNKAREPKVDRIGTLVVNRAEKRERLVAEIAEMRAAVTGARRIMADAARERGADAASVAYLYARYAKGMRHADAARAAHLTDWQARAAARRVAPALYDCSPASFDMPVGEDNATFYGFDQAMRTGA